MFEDYTNRLTNCGLSRVSHHESRSASLSFNAYWCSTLVALSSWVKLGAGRLQEPNGVAKVESGRFPEKDACCATGYFLSIK